MPKTWIAAAAALALAACAHTQPTPQDQFYANLMQLCGGTFLGRLVSTDAADADMSSERLVMHVRDCSDSAIAIPFNVGENRSRTWIISRTESGLRLKHDHRHEDGSEDRLTQYGGDTTQEGSATRQDFPADQFSRDLFIATGIPQSAANVWSMDVRPGEIFAYELRRPNRHFRVEFDLAHPRSTPPPSWGAQGSAP